MQKGLIQKVLMRVLEPSNANKFMQRDLAPLVQLIRMRLVQNDFKQQGLNTLALLLGLHFFQFSGLPLGPCVVSKRQVAQALELDQVQGNLLLLTFGVVRQKGVDLQALRNQELMREEMDLRQAHNVRKLNDQFLGVARVWRTLPARRRMNVLQVRSWKLWITACHQL